MEFPFLHGHTNSSPLELCLQDLPITNLTEPVLKFIHFKAKCRMDRLKDKLEWENYCLKNNIHLTLIGPSLTNHPKQSQITQTEPFTRPQACEKVTIERKSVSIQTLNVKNKTVQVKIMDIPYRNRQVKEPQPQSKKRENIKPGVNTDHLKMSPTMLQLENHIFEELVIDVKCEMESIGWKNKIEEMKIKENKLKAVRKQIRKLEEKSETSNSSKSEDISRCSPVPRKPLCLSIPEDKFKRITQHNSQFPEMTLKIPGLTSELLDQ